MTSGVGHVKLSRDRESRRDKLANNSAGERTCVTSGAWLVQGWGNAGALGSVNRMAAAPTTR